MSEVSPLELIEELMAELDGLTSEEYRLISEMRSRLAAAGEKYRRKPPSAWPKLAFNWDFKTESQRFSLDGIKSLEFAESYPQGFLLGHVAVAEFEKKLCHFNRRNDVHELWDCGSGSKLCSMLAYLAEGLPIAPPLVTVTPANELCFHGGNHRYTVAKFSGLAVIPIYAEPTNRAAIERLVPVSWADI